MKTAGFVALLTLTLCCAAPASGQTLDWVRQFGTASEDRGTGVSVDELGNVYISGYTEGSLEGTNSGGNDAFLRKYDANGALQWTTQLGTVLDDQSHGVSADGLGSIFISGSTEGNLAGTNAGGFHCEPLKAVV